MSSYLSPDHRHHLSCDACSARIIADPGTHAEQRAQLRDLATELRWARPSDIGDLCPECATQLPPSIGPVEDAPIVHRDDLCRRRAWCVLAHGHAPPCREAPKRAMPPVDLTHKTVKKRWG